MGFSNPIFLWTLIFPLIVLLYYFFRKKYKDRSISSTLFWNEVMKETRVSPYLKHLQQNALLYLQLIALLILMLALMNPYFQRSEIAGEQVIWIVDTSATMQAGKGSSTFEEHKSEMKALLSEIGSRPVTIITTGEEPKVTIRQETDTKKIHKAIDDLVITYEEEQLSKAFDVAQALVGEKTTSIYLFTDSIERSELPIENEHVEWIVKGAAKDLNNIAITKFAATNNGDGSIAFVQLKNETSIEQTGTLTIKNEEGTILKEESFSIEPMGELSKIYEQLPSASYMTANINVVDDYKVDNVMSAILNNSLSQIVVDQQMHALVQKGFQTLSGDVKIAQSDQLETMSNEAVVVTNKSKLLKSSPSPIVLIGRDDELTEEVNSLISVSKDSLFAFGSFDNVYVSSVYPPFKDFETIATAGDKPFIQRSARGDIIILADIQATDWPLHPSFPLFLWSVQNELTEGAQNLGVFMPNEARGVSLTGGEWTIYSSDNEYISSIDSANKFKVPSEPGLYTIRSENEVKHFLVQISPKERSISEGTSFQLGKITTSDKEETRTESLSTWLLLIVLLVFVAEWEVQRRRGFTN